MSFHGARHTCPQGWVPRVLLRRVVLCGGVCFVFVPFGVCNGGGGGGGYMRQGTRATRDPRKTEV